MLEDIIMRKKLRENLYQIFTPFYTKILKLLKSYNIKIKLININQIILMKLIFSYMEYKVQENHLLLIL